MVISEQQKKFARNWLEHFNGTKAAIYAGYSPTSASTQSHHLLANPLVISYIAELQQPVLKKSNITRQRVIDEIGRIAFADKNDLEANDYDFARTVSPKDKSTALNMLGKHFNIFEQHQEAGKDKVTVNIHDKDSEA